MPDGNQSDPENTGLCGIVELISNLSLLWEFFQDSQMEDGPASFHMFMCTAGGCLPLETSPFDAGPSGYGGFQADVLSPSICFRWATEQH